MAQKRRKTISKKIKNKNITNSGVVHIQSTLNNTIVTITNLAGDTISWASSGSTGFRGTRKKTPFAAQIATQKASLDAFSFSSGLKLKNVDIQVKGQGSGRETAIRAIQAAGFAIHTIEDITPISHNGCRSPKRRRV